MPRSPALLHPWHLLLFFVASLAASPMAAAKPTAHAEPTATLYGFAIPHEGCAPSQKPSTDAKLCTQRDEAACERKLRSFGTLQGVDAEALPHAAGLAQIHVAYGQLAQRDPSPDLDTARSKFEKALTYRPNYADFYANLGAALLALGDPAALAALQKALTLRHNDPRLLNNLALAQRLASLPDQSRATLLQVRVADPKLPAPLYNLAVLRLDTLRDAAGLAEIRELLGQFKQLRGPLPASQPDPADAVLAEAEGLLAWRMATTH